MDGDIVGGSEIGNPAIVIGKVTYSHTSSPVNKALVRLRPSNYLSDSSYLCDSTNISKIRNLYTDALGNFKIDSVDTGQYFIEVNDNNQYCYLYKIEVISIDTTINLPRQNLGKMCKLQGNVYYEESNLEHLSVQIYGLERLTQTDSNGLFEFFDLPSGEFTVNVPYSDLALGPWEKKTDFISSGDSHDLDTIYLIPYDRNFKNDSLILTSILNNLGNPISFDSAAIIADNVHSITGIYLNGLGIKNIPEEIFDLSPSIRIIHLEDNQLTDFMIPNGAWTNLKELYIQNNRLTSLTIGLAWIKYVIVVDFSDNYIEDILLPMFLNLPDLKVFKINNNRINYIPKEVGQAPSLETFEVAKNNLYNLPSTIMNVKTLKQLDVNYNHLLSLSNQLDTWVKQFQPNYLNTQSR